jgi:uncharacterized Zn-binding protein involved in type VI secretion
MTTSLLTVALIVFSSAASYAQAPAARQQDVTTHGGTVTTGDPTVIIAGQPAARVNDVASCPVVPPQPGPPPHIGGSIVTGSATVRIGGRPAARAGDSISENGAVSTIASGAPTVRIGN